MSGILSNFSTVLKTRPSVLSTTAATCVRYKGLHPSARKALKQESKKVKKVKHTEEEIRNMWIQDNPPGRPFPEWNKDPALAEKVLRDRRRFHKAFARYEMHCLITAERMVDAAYDHSISAVAELSKVSPELGKMASQQCYNMYPKEFVGDLLPDTPPIRGWNPEKRQVDPDLIRTPHDYAQAIKERQALLDKIDAKHA